jgi:hypothetical protein
MPYFHSHTRIRVFPSASASYSKTAARLFSRASFGEAVSKYARLGSSPTVPAR